MLMLPMLLQPFISPLARYIILSIVDSIRTYIFCNSSFILTNTDSNTVSVNTVSGEING